VSEYRVEWLIGDTFKVVFLGTVKYQGSLANCEAYIRLHEKGCME